MNQTRIAFAGFRHGHIHDMVNRCKQRPDVAVVACCEEDAPTRQALAQAGQVAVTHDDYARMLREVDCDVVAIGDYYGKRGPMALAAVRAGRHVLADKPLCTTLTQLDAIESAARSGGRVVSLMLDMRDSPVFLGVREAVRSGAIGAVRAVAFGGQHPLNFGSRPGWYFEPGKHGGTLNDIAIHAIDMIPWATGLAWHTLIGARCWHHLPESAPHFNGCAQFIAQLEGGAGVVGDVSYLSPDSHGYSVPFYWRFNFWGDGGMIEAAYNAASITLYQAGEMQPRQLPLPPGRPGGYLDSFLDEIRGRTDGLHLSGAQALAAARRALTIQDAADRGVGHVRLA